MLECDTNLRQQNFSTDCQRAVTTNLLRGYTETSFTGSSDKPAYSWAPIYTTSDEDDAASPVEVIRPLLVTSLQGQEYAERCARDE